MPIVGFLNEILWNYILIILLLGCAVWFTIRTHGVQFRMIGDMLKLLVEKNKYRDKKHNVSSFQAFAISIASRVGTGNLAGVATAIVLGGPGAIFWMWIIAILGGANAFVESTLAQLYKVKSEKSFIGGPAYYIKKGLHSRLFASVFAILILFTFGFAFNSVQSNTITAAFSSAFGIDKFYLGAIITTLTLTVIFGGVHRIAKVSEIIVPSMAIAYIMLAIFVIIIRFDRIPHVLELIIGNAFGFEQIMGGGIGMAVLMGIKRGLFSNEAGMGSAPNIAATANVSHPVKQGLIQTLGVYTDTIIVCSCTAFIILCSGIFDSGLSGIELTQASLNNEIGNTGSAFIAITILFFGFTSIIGNYYYGESNLYFMTRNKKVLFAYRTLVGGMVMYGSLAELNHVWSLADLCMGLMTLCNLCAIILLGKYAILCLKDYQEQKRQGKNPRYHSSTIPQIANETECWK